MPAGSARPISHRLSSGSHYSPRSRRRSIGLALMRRQMGARGAFGIASSSSRVRDRSHRTSASSTTWRRRCGLPGDGQDQSTNAQCRSPGAPAAVARPLLEGTTVTGSRRARRPRRGVRWRAQRQEGSIGCEALVTARGSGHALRTPGRRQRAAVFRAEHFYVVPSESTASRRPPGDPRPRRVTSTTRRRSVLVMGGSSRWPTVGKSTRFRRVRVPAAAEDWGPVRGADGQCHPPQRSLRRAPGQ